MLEQNVFNFYKEYLKGVAFAHGRPYKLPSSLDSLNKKKGEKGLIYKLVGLLYSKGISERKSYKKFIDVCLYILKAEDFHSSIIMQDFKKIMIKYDNFDDIFREEKLDIKSSMSFLEEYCIMNDISSLNELKRGHPPILVKLWKQKKIDKYTFVYLFDINSIIKQRWAKIYLGSFNSVKAKNLMAVILDNEELLTTIQKSNAKFKRLFKGVTD